MGRLSQTREPLVGQPISALVSSRIAEWLAAVDRGAGTLPQALTPELEADVLSRVFDPFFTTKDAGSGLGLAMTLRIMREHGGDVVAKSTAGEGATFTVHLPAAAPAKRR